MKQTSKGALLAAAGAIGWGISGVCSQYLFSLYTLDSGWLTAVRMVFSGLLLLCAVLPKQGRQLFAVFSNKRDMGWLLAFAIAGLLFCQLTFMGAIQHSNSGTATVLQSLNVIIMALVMSLYNRERIGISKILAIALAVFGTWLIVTNGKLSSMVLSPMGLAMGLCAAVGVVTYTLLSRPVISKYGNMYITGWGMLIGGIVLSAIVKIWQVPEGLDLRAVIMIGIIVLVGTAISFSLFLEGVKLVGPTKATLIGCLEPASATVLSALFLHTRFGVAELIGFVCIMITVYLSMKESK